MGSLSGNRRVRLHILHQSRQLFLFLEKSVGAAHEGIMEASEVNPVLHLFGGKVCRVALACNVINFDGLVLSPLTDGVVPLLEVTGGFHGHVVRPFDTGLVIVTKWVCTKTDGLN